MSDAHSFDPTVLREYDIRGIVGKTLHEADARAVGRAFGTIVVRGGGSSACVGYDGRFSSPGFADAMVEGLASTGLTVNRIGLGPTLDALLRVQAPECRCRRHDHRVAQPAGL